MSHISFECSECEPPAPTSSTLNMITCGADEEEAQEVGTFVLGWFENDLREPPQEETAIFPLLWSDSKFAQVSQSLTQEHNTTCVVNLSTYS